MSERILIVEDDKKIARMIELELGHEGYDTDIAYDGETGLKQASEKDFDLILLDIMMPKISGIEVLRKIRKTKNVPIIFLTARDEIIDKVLGLDSGADDYITKPFVIEELLARIRSAIRKHTGLKEDVDKHSNILSFGLLALDQDSHIVTYDKEPVELTHKEFELLKCLLENKGRVMSRDSLLNNIWGYDFFGGANTVDVHIRFLRAKIDEHFNVKIITTVRGAGYKI